MPFAGDLPACGFAAGRLRAEQHRQTRGDRVEHDRPRHQVAGRILVVDSGRGFARNRVCRMSRQGGETLQLIFRDLKSRIPALCEAQRLRGCQQVSDKGLSRYCSVFWNDDSVCYLFF